MCRPGVISQTILIWYPDYAQKLLVLRLVNLAFRLCCSHYAFKYSHYAFLVLSLGLAIVVHTSTHRHHKSNLMPTASSCKLAIASDEDP
jgi:hypothetical protein